MDFATTIALVSAIAGTVVVPFAIWQTLLAHRAISATRAKQIVSAPIHAPPPPSPPTSRLDRILQTRCLRVGVMDYPPLMHVDIKGDGLSVSGIYPRVLDRVALAHGITLKWIPLLWGDTTDAVQDDIVDIVCCIFNTPKRAGSADFAGFMHRIGVTGMVRIEDTRVHDHNDLADRDIRVGVVRGEIGWEYATDQLNLGFDSKRFVILDQIEISNVGDLLLDERKSKRVDVVLADSLSCWTFCQNNSDTVRQVFSHDQLYICDCGFMLRREEGAFKEWIDQNIKEWRNDPDLLAAEQAELVPLKDIVRPRRT